MVVGDIVRKVGGIQKYKIEQIEDDKAICILYPHGNQQAKFTFKITDLEKVS